ncbi:alcohol oxidase [Corynespora cassiicola Philippines]|uniref:Alcohol oxidase n=1 Tax=Corynespora cassiicola Philippines TaxID=1448308 RepID=A0A2T2NH92_CORCC|nr:alcohol oxidase [Corynespora cassiicola Philippines]
MAAENFDFVIVGGGTAGLVLANRLSSKFAYTIAVVEAGGDVSADPRVFIPGLFSAAAGSEMDWKFATTPQDGLYGRRIGQTQGKALGGSSAINAEALIPFSSSDLDSWKSIIGNQGWNSSLVSYLNKTFSIVMPDADTTRHLNISWAEDLASSGKGPVNASFLDAQQDPVPKAWVDAFANLGYSLTASPFSGNSTGPYNTPSTVNSTTKTRAFSTNSYYLPVAARSNLHMFLHSFATRILLTEGDHRATGVEFVQDNVTKTITAKKEVILCAGTFNSPKLLELSDIGDPEVLNTAVLKTKVANQYVGSNLQDHIICGVSFEARDGIPTGDDLMRNDPDALQLAMALYQEHQARPFATSGVTSFGYLPIVDFVNDTAAKNSLLESLSSETPIHPLDSARIFKLHYLIQSAGGADTTSGVVPSPQPGNFISLVAGLSHPLSTGTVHITSADASAPPILNHRYLSNPIDLELHARHVRYLETIATTHPFSTSILKPEGKRNDPRSMFGGSLDKAKEFVKLASTTNWHSVGTCAMAPREMGGVVDENLRVYEVQGLRVVDASIFPLVPQSNTQSLVYVIAERASELILEAWK